VAGDRDARETLLREQLAGLRAYVRLRLGRAIRARETSQDLVQSVCREVLEDLGAFEYRGEASFRHWLFRRAENKIRDRGRYWGREKRAAERELASAGRAQDDDAELLAQFETFTTPSRDASAKEELERVEDAFARLSGDYREVILLARVVGLPHKEVAAQMGRSAIATRTLLSRALARLATLLEGEGE